MNFRQKIAYLEKKADYDFSQDPAYQALFQDWQAKQQNAYDAHAQFDPELRRKSNAATSRGIMSGLTLGGLGGAVGLGALRNLESKRNGNGVIKRSLKSVGGGLKGGILGGITGAALGGLASIPISEHYDKQQDPAVVAQYKDARKQENEADSQLVHYELEKGAFVKAREMMEKMADAMDEYFTPYDIDDEHEALRDQLDAAHKDLSDKSTTVHEGTRDASARGSRQGLLGGGALAAGIGAGIAHLRQKPLLSGAGYGIPVGMLAGVIAGGALGEHNYPKKNPDAIQALREAKARKDEADRNLDSFENKHERYLWQ